MSNTINERPSMELFNPETGSFEAVRITIRNSREEQQQLPEQEVKHQEKLAALTAAKNKIHAVIAEYIHYQPAHIIFFYSMSNLEVEHYISLCTSQEAGKRIVADIFRREINVQVAKITGLMP